MFHLQGIFDARLSNIAAPSMRRPSRAGQFEVDLNECLDGKVKRIWRSLEPRTEKDDVSGDVELVLQWRYNARLDFCPFDGFVDEHEGELLCGIQPVRYRADPLAEIASRRWRGASEV